ncbi:MAG: ergothioneine biosynthesis glutamate--cysteine ligase EgtA [Nocardioides sp.]
MTAQHAAPGYATPPEAPSGAPLDLDGAHAHVAATALRPDTGGRVGLELELHLVDLDQVGLRPDWAAVRGLVDGLPALPQASTVTIEPGGQVELSTPPGADVKAAVSALRADLAVLRAHLREQGYGLAALGADPARPVGRVNPGPRYAAMEAHFAAMGCGLAGREMMTATAALQVNLDAGPAAGWADRVALLRALVPVLVAVSAGSPWLAGRTSGWHSMRQETWYAIDHGRTDPVAAGDPGEAWAGYALAAPVMLVADACGLAPVGDRLSFADWVAEPGRLGRAPTTADLDYHLTTLFPPVRPRGYVEVRCLDALPDRWWPALAALTVTLVDDPVAADRAAELCEPVAHSLDRAAREGLADAALRRAVAGCADVAARHCPAGLAEDVGRLAELLVAGRTPGEELRRTADTHGPLRLLEEEADA